LQGGGNGFDQIVLFDNSHGRLVTLNGTSGKIGAAFAQRASADRATQRRQTVAGNDNDRTSAKRWGVMDVHQVVFCCTGRRIPVFYTRPRIPCHVHADWQCARRVNWYFIAAVA
jgi:hypothetical protein